MFRRTDGIFGIPVFEDEGNGFVLGQSIGLFETVGLFVSFAAAPVACGFGVTFAGSFAVAMIVVVILPTIEAGGCFE